MKKQIFISLLLFFCACKTFVAQEKLYFTTNEGGSEEYWRINTSNGSPYENVTTLLNAQTASIGGEHGPISVSRNGMHVIFQSERFDNDALGWEAMTIFNSAFTSFTVPRFADNSLLRAEGLLAITNSGDTIIFTDGSGNHSRDIFLTYKSGNFWTAPQNLTTTSTFDYNANPYLSNDGRKILFDAGASSYPTTAIGQINLDDISISFPITTSDIASATLLKSGAYLNDGSIIFECETDAERIWKHTSLANSPIIPSFTNDNSPIVLPSGKIASVYLPAGLHHIKIMDHNGLNDFMLSTSNPNFTEIADIGISAGGSASLAVEEAKENSKINVFPNPVNDFLLIDGAEKLSSIQLYSTIGQLIHTFQIYESLKGIDVSFLQKGHYILKINDRFNKAIIKQ